MVKVKVTKVKSTIKVPERQKRTMAALGLRKMHQCNELPLNAAVLGMIKKVSHLIKVEEIAS